MRLPCHLAETLAKQSKNERGNKTTSESVGDVEKTKLPQDVALYWLEYPGTSPFLCDTKLLAE